MTNTEPLADSGERVEFVGGGVRDPEIGKPRFDLLLPEGVPYDEQILTRFAVHMGKGAEKYSQRNWELMADDVALDRAKSSALRHMIQWITDDDSEPGSDHAAAILFNVMAAETIAYKNQEYGGTSIFARERAVHRRERELDKRDKMAERAHLEALLPQFEADVISPDDQAQTRQTLIDQFASTIAPDEPVVVLSGDVASLFQELVQEGKTAFRSPNAVYAKLEDLLAAIGDVDSDKQDSVGSDRPTSTDQIGGNNVR